MNQSLTNKSRTFSVLFVCLGNICRSPTAEGVFRHLLALEGATLDVDVDSAGTGDYHIGEPPDVRSQSAAMQRGIDLSGLRARQVNVCDFDRFGLILAMDRSNVRALQALKPKASRAEVRLLLEYAGSLVDLEVPDPYFGGQDGFERVLDLVTLASRGLISALQQRRAPIGHAEYPAEK
jgi:protein-tyrosine phosphatase